MIFKYRLVLFACAIYYSLHAGGNLSKQKVSYKSLMSSILMLEHADFEQDQRLKDLCELFGGDGWGSKSQNRYGGILKFDRKLYANNLPIIIAHCKHLPKGMMHTLLHDLEKDVAGVLIRPVYVPHYGWQHFPITMQEIESFLQLCTQYESSDALLEMNDFLHNQNDLLLKAQLYHEKKSRARVHKVKSLFEEVCASQE